MSRLYYYDSDHLGFKKKLIHYCNMLFDKMNPIIMSVKLFSSTSASCSSESSYTSSASNSTSQVSSINLFCNMIIRLLYSILRLFVQKYSCFIFAQTVTFTIYFNKIMKMIILCQHLFSADSMLKI